MDFEFIREQTPLYIEAAKLTLHMAVIGVLLAIVVGLVCSMIKYFRIPVLRQIVECYIELSRNTPLLIQLFFLYFGLPKIGIVLSSEQCAITGLTFSEAVIWQKPSEAAWTMFHPFRWNPH